MNEDSHLFAGNEEARRGLHDEFLRWQCRLRRWCVREEGGRPMPGMCPEVRLPEETDALGRIVTLLVRRESRTTARELRHLVLKTHDPRVRYTAALRMLGGDYYQQPRAFGEELTALFGSGSTVLQRLLQAGRCTLDFAQSETRFMLPCALSKLSDSDLRFQATYWHNRLFNDTMPPAVAVVLFEPDWTRASQNLA